MEGKQSIYYALGILCYAIAKSDGTVQDEESQRLFDIVRDETNHHIDFQYAEIIFQILERDGAGFEATYNWAIEELKRGRHYLSPELKEKMISVIKQIALAFDWVSREEFNLIERFEKDLTDIGSEHYLK